MANRILTPSNVPNLFGLGLPGFGDDPNPMLATAFDASWCNGIQEEIIRIIEYGVTNGIGVPPNGAIFDQVLTVLRSFPFDGNPTFTQIVIAGMASLELGLDVTGPGDVTAALFNGVGESAITAVNASAQPTTITVNTGTGRAQFSQNNDPTSCTAVYENLGAGCTFKATNNGAMATVELTNNSGGAGLLVNGSVILGIDVTTPVESKGVLAMSEGGTVAAAKTLTLVGNAAVTGTATSPITAGRFIFLSGGPALPATALGINVSDELFYGPSARVHASLNGWVYGTGDQEAATILSVSTIAATTSASVLGRGNGLVKVIVEGWGQRATVGNVEIDVQQDQGTATWIDIGNVQTVEWVDTSNANLWSYFRHERTLNAGTATSIFYRLKIDGAGGTSAKIRETNLRVVSERA